MKPGPKPRTNKIFWSSKLAYAIGLITTDGNLSPDGRHFCFVSNDIQLIKTFKNCLGITNKIAPKRSGYTKKESSYCVQFGNVTFYNWCLKIGLMPNKSKKLKSLLIPDKYFFDFLRGHIDGDGSIRKFQDPVYKNSQRLYTIFNSASLEHLYWIRKNLMKLLNIKEFIRESSRVYKLTYAKKESILLLKSVYYSKNLPCLERKYIIAKSIL